MTLRATKRKLLLVAVAVAIAIALGGSASAATRDGVAASHDADRFVLRLGEVAFDPIDGLPPLPTGWDRSASGRADLHLVQLHGATRAATLASIKARGLDVVQYVHPFTYIVWGTAAQLRDLRSIPAVRATADFAPGFRVQPRWRDLDADPQDVRALIYRGADGDAVVRTIEGLGGRSIARHVLHGKLEVATFRVPGDRIRAVAGVPGVYSVRLQPKDGGLRSEMSDQVCVNNVDGSNIAFPGYESWLAGVGLDGSGVILANVDSGIAHSHVDLEGRMLECSGDTCGGPASSGHGTHTAGIMAADGTSGTLDSFGFLRGLGMAPGANLVEQLYYPWFTQPDGMLKLMTDSVRNGAPISGNSWGPSGSPQGYDDDTLQVDVGVRDADPDAPGHQPLTYVLSFMNGYGGTSSQGTPDEAKNIFTIGSTKMRDAIGAQDPDIDDLSPNSAHGPALDGRTIPHLVAPGCEVDSTLPGGYGLNCGTSMASPHAAGAVALFFQYYRGLPDSSADPSPALVKAVFLAVGRDLAGNRDADGGTLGHPFDSKQGWGRMDVAAVVDPPPNSVRYFDDPMLLDDTGQEWSTNVSPYDPLQPMRIMLVWTDAPGHGLGGSTPAWNNDLDLVVEIGTDTYRGNHFGSDGFSLSGGSADAMHNTEGVFLPASASGSATVRVVASNINSDGVPDVGDDTDQDFALVCYNCTAEAGFTLTVDPDSQSLCAPATAGYEIQVGATLGFADPVTLSVSGAPAGAGTDFSVNPVTPPGTSLLDLTATEGAAAGEFVLTIDGQSGDLQRSVAVDLRIDADPPGPATLNSPADGAIDVPVTPTLVWDAVAQAMAYDVEVALDPGFATVVYGATASGTSHAVLTPLDPLTNHYWRVRASNACGDGVDSATFAFTTFDSPPVLLVDDDDNDPDVRGAYTGALDALDVAYDLWDTGNSDFEPQLQDLTAYEAVIWFSGDEYGGSAGPGPDAESALSAWLDGGRCLLLASQDYHYDRGLTGFMQAYLGVASVADDEDQSTVSGQGTVFEGLGPYELAFPYTNFSDVVQPDVTAEVAFLGDVGNAAVSKATVHYLSTFWTFGLETLPSDSDRDAVLSAFFSACHAMAGPDSDQDGLPDEEDCAPADPDNWNPPGAAEDFKIGAATRDNLVWSAPDEPGGTSLRYDVLRSAASSEFGAADCVEVDIPGTVGSDMVAPPSGQVRYYLVRVRNGCGETLGVDSDGEPRPDGASCS